MNRTINQLIQLQELHEAKAQLEVTESPSGPTQLNEAIARMTADLPEQVASLYRRVHQRYPLAVVPVTGGRACAGCGMSLPISQVHTIRAMKTIEQCPNCKRILFAPHESTPVYKNPPNKPAVGGVGITRFSSFELMHTGMEAKTGEDVLAAICHDLKAKDFFADSDALLQRALERESIISTAVAHGLAFPHVRGIEGGGLTLAVGIVPKGVHFGAQGRGLTRIFFFMIIPTAASAFYLKLLAGLAATFQKEAAREKLLKAQTPEALWKALCQTTKKTVA